MKGKANHQKKNCTSFQLLSVTPADTVLTQCFVKILILVSKNLVKGYKCYQKHGITCTFTLMQTTRNLIFHICFVRVQVLIGYINTRLQRVFNSFFKNNPDLSVVSDPRIVLRHKQARLTLEKLGFLLRSTYNDGVL